MAAIPAGGFPARVRFGNFDFDLSNGSAHIPVSNVGRLPGALRAHEPSSADRPLGLNSTVV